MNKNLLEILLESRKVLNKSLLPHAISWLAHTGTLMLQYVDRWVNRIGEDCIAIVIVAGTTERLV